MGLRAKAPALDAEQLFREFFLPLYPPDVRADLAAARATDANPAGNAGVLAHLDDAADRFVRGASSLFGADLALDRSDASVHRLSAALTPARREAWAGQGEPGTAESALFNAVVHGAAYVGATIVARHGGVWGVRRPLWESVVRLRSRAGEGDLAIFHWWLKSLTAPEGAATLADRYRAHVEVPCADPESLPVVVSGPRHAPRLKRPTYASMHQLLRAHFPEIRDLGADFPTAERFEAFGLTWLEAHVLGGGRMVLLAGASAAGLHLFWLTAAGFEKSALVACDAFPDPVVRVKGETLALLTRVGGEERSHELLWWGP